MRPRLAFDFWPLLTEFVDLVLGGGVPEFAREFFYGATLTALVENDGGVRPITVVNTLRRLAVKMGSKHHICVYLGIP